MCCAHRRRETCTFVSRLLLLRCRLYSSQAPITATLFPGDGIGPEIADAVKKIFKAADAPIEWDEQYISKTADPRTNSFITRENLDSVLVRALRLVVTNRHGCHV